MQTVIPDLDLPNLLVASPSPSKGLSICIPVYNESQAIGNTLSRCLALGDALRLNGVEPFEIIAVDDGSTDDTSEVIQQYAGVRLIRHAQNRGYGAALKTGFAAAQHDLIGFIDADATYPPEWFPPMCAAIASGADLVVGSRMAGAETGMPPIRRLGNAVFAKLLTLIGRTPVTDSASGMRVFDRKVLELVGPLPDGLNLTPVMSTRAVHEGITLVEVPIPYSERVGTSKLSVARDGLRFLTTIVSAALEYNPVRIFGFAGLLAVGVSLVMLLSIVGLRLRGVTTLGAWGTFAVFASLVSGVTGVTVFAMGASFNYLVSLFYRRPIRQGLFRRPLFQAPIERLFLPTGSVSMLFGTLIAATSIWLSLRGWPIERLWLYLTLSAIAVLIGVQLLSWWLMTSALGELSRRLLVAHREGKDDGR